MTRFEFLLLPLQLTFMHLHFFDSSFQTSNLFIFLIQFNLERQSRSLLAFCAPTGFNIIRGVSSSFFFFFSLCVKHRKQVEAKFSDSCTELLPFSAFVTRSVFQLFNDFCGLSLDHISSFVYPMSIYLLLVFRRERIRQ